MPLSVKTPRVLISVTDKTGLVDFASALHLNLNYEIVSTGGTAKVLREAGLVVTDVSEVTGFPEILDGRVKTLHPKVAAGILGVRSNQNHMLSLAEHGILPFDMVVVNLYDFSKVAAKPGASLAELVENIDIGGPTMIRAAAKNWQDIAVLTGSDDYLPVLAELHEQQGGISLSTKWELAKAAFAYTAEYDRVITRRFMAVEVQNDGTVLDESAGSEGPEDVGGHIQADQSLLTVVMPCLKPLRYGENPHQQAWLYGRLGHGVAGGKQMHGKELSYNNLVDMDAAWQLINEFVHPACAIVKHTNPCGCAVAETVAAAYQRALECDPVSAFGSVIAFNTPVDEETATQLASLFVEVVIAPDFSITALGVLVGKKNLRVVKIAGSKPDLVIKSIDGGFLAQTPDHGVHDVSSWRVVTAREPSVQEWVDLSFAWPVAKHTKSNAIVYVRDRRVVGVGAGQMSRVDSARLGVSKSVLGVHGSVVASDAFFPFPDGLEVAARAGASAFVQPGGSKQDPDVIAAANRLGVSMVFTDVRHFRH